MNTFENSAINNAKEYIRELFLSNSDGHDAEHTMRVYKNALLIAKDYPECDLELVSLSALLHDADDYKLFRTENNYNARSFLSEQGIENEKADMICEIINQISFSKNRGKAPSSIEGKIVQDADRLDAMGAIGIARTFAFGGKNKRSLNDSVSHFYEKLLLLKDEMNTERGRELAKTRHSFLELYLEELEKETSF